MKIEINDYWELMALHKSLMATKFDPDAYYRELQGSPYTASLAFKIFDLLVESSDNEEISAYNHDWLEWQQADKSREETKLLIKRIEEENDWWSKADKATRIKYVKDFMAPLILDTEIQNDIVENC